MFRDILIVGAGQAAVQTAVTLRQRGFDGAIRIVGAESELPYQRPPLSKKYLAGTLDAGRLHLRPASYYEEHEVELVLDARVTSIEPERNCVRTASGRELGYDALLLATGSRPRRLEVSGAELLGVHYLRTVADADTLRESFASEAPLVIVGGGYIGLEVAAVAVQQGRAVTVLEAAERVMSRVVGEQVSSFYEARHREAGVEIVCGAAVERIEGKDRVTGVRIQDGRRFECGAVVAAVGIEPRTELALAAGLDVDDGIRVNELARTSASTIFAVGDCTSHPSALYGRRVRLESVHNAIEQAKTAALTLLDEQHPYVDVPWFWSDQYELKLQIAGLSAGHDSVVARGSPDHGHFALFYLRQGRVIAVDAINSPRDFIAGKKLVAERAVVPPALLADIDSNLGALR